MLNKNEKYKVRAGEKLKAVISLGGTEKKLVQNTEFEVLEILILQKTLYLIEVTSAGTYQNQRLYILAKQENKVEEI